MHRDQSQEQAGYLKQVVTNSPLPLTALLGRTTVTIDEIMALKTGDVLVLDERTNVQLKAFVRDQLRLLGRPGRIGKHAAFLVEQVVPDGRERHT
jgi:flagellar motor switch protein FliM